MHVVQSQHKRRFVAGGNDKMIAVQGMAGLVVVAVPIIGKDIFVCKAADFVQQRKLALDMRNAGVGGDVGKVAKGGMGEKQKIHVSGVRAPQSRRKLHRHLPQPRPRTPHPPVVNENFHGLSLKFKHSFRVFPPLFPFPPPSFIPASSSIPAKAGISRTPAPTAQITKRRQGDSRFRGNGGKRRKRKAGAVFFG